MNVSTSEQWVLLSSLCPAGCDFEFNLWHNCVSFAFRSSDGLKFQLCVILFDNQSWYRSNIYMKKIATVASNNIREVPTAFCQNSFKHIEQAYWSQFFIYLYRSFTMPTFEWAASKGFSFSSKSSGMVILWLFNFPNEISSFEKIFLKCTWLLAPFFLLESFLLWIA